MAKRMKSGTQPKAKTAPLSTKPKKLSKAGEWLEAHPGGIGLVIHDMRAVMK